MGKVSWKPKAKKAPQSERGPSKSQPTQQQGETSNSTQQTQQVDLQSERKPSAALARESCLHRMSPGFTVKCAQGPFADMNIPLRVVTQLDAEDEDRDISARRLAELT